MSANNHNMSTEILIVTSQTVFFVLLFLLLKSWLIDKRGMLNSQEKIREDVLQIIAIFFSIFVVVGLFMIPVESYEYAHYVVPITYTVMIIIVLWEVYMVFNGPSSSQDCPKSPKNSDLESSGSRNWFATSSSTNTPPKRPVNF